MRPVFYSNDVREVGSVRLLKEEHLKMDLQQIDSKTMESIGFGMGKYIDAISAQDSFQVCYIIDRNTFRGRSKLQLQIRDIKF